jgi:nitrogen fixation NifU-like protein
MDPKQVPGFSPQVIEHFENPRNVGRIDGADGVGTIVNPICGDTTELYLRIKNGVVEDAKFHSLGCAVTIASASVFTEKIKGYALAGLLARPSGEVVTHLLSLIEAELGELPSMKLHCPPATVEAFFQAVGQHSEKEGDAPTVAKIKEIIPLIAQYYERGKKKPAEAE